VPEDAAAADSKLNDSPPVPKCYPDRAQATGTKDFFDFVAIAKKDGLVIGAGSTAISVAFHDDLRRRARERSPCLLDF
jgi:hypothetical protein